MALTRFEKSFLFDPPTGAPPEGSMFEADPTPAEQIERLEAQIDELREAIQRSRRLVVAGRAGAFAGAALLVALAFGLATFTPIRMIVGISLGLGGLVLMGSSVGSTRQLELSLKRTEDERNAAIDALALVQLGDGAR
jgi:tetrahydromethanopterin S-methyltransferase subunit B